MKKKKTWIWIVAIIAAVVIYMNWDKIAPKMQPILKKMGMGKKEIPQIMDLEDLKDSVENYDESIA